MRKMLGVAACVIAATMIATRPVQSQAIGLKAGGSSTSLHQNPEGEANLESLSSFTGGPFIRFGIAGVALQIEALAMTKGSHVVFEEPGRDFTMKLEYIEVPVTLMVALSSGVYGFFGPSFGFETGCSAAARGGEDDFDSECPGLFDESEFERKKLDIGGTLGVGSQWPMGPGMVLLEGRYTHGLTNLNNSADDMNKLRNSAWIVLAGYSIAIGR